MNLTNNNCLLQQTIALEKDNTIDVLDDTNLVDLLRRNVHIFEQISTFPEISIIDNSLFCSSLTNCIKYGETLSLLEIEAYKNRKENFIFNIYFFKSPSSSHCQVNNILLNNTACTEEIAKFANLLGSPQISFPRNFDEQFLFNPFSLSNQNTYVLALQNGKLRFINSGKVCCFSNGIIQLHELHTDNINLLKQNVKDIYNFIHPIGKIDNFQTQQIFCDNAIIVDIWRNFQKHTQKLYFLLSKQSDFFPSIIFSSSHDCTLDSAVQEYLNIISIVQDKSYHKRDVLDLLFNGSELKTLSKNSKVVAKNFAKIKVNEDSITKNQKVLAANAEVLYKYQGNLQKAQKHLQNKINNVFVDMTLSNLHFDMMTRIQELSMLTHVNYLLLLQHHVTIKNIINNILSLGKNNCQFNQILTCGLQKPNLFFESDLLAVYKAEKLKFTNEIFVSCLPIKNKSRFLAHEQTFIEKEGFFYNKNMETFSKYCFSDQKLCKNNYQNNVMPTFARTCNVIHNYFYIAINCQRETTLTLNSGTTTIVNHEPKFFAISELPLFSGKYNLTLSDLQLSLNHINSSSHFESHLNITGTVLQLIEDNKFNLITQPPSIQSDLIDLVDLDRVSGHQIISGTFLLIIIMFSACSCFACYRYPNFRKNIFHLLFCKACRKSSSTLSQPPEPVQNRSNPPPSSSSSSSQRQSSNPSSSTFIERSRKISKIFYKPSKTEEEEAALSIIHTPLR